MPGLSNTPPRETRSGITFKVFEFIEGDECLVFERDTFEEAKTALLNYAATLTDPEASLSIAHGLDGILALWDPDRGYVAVPDRS